MKIIKTKDDISSLVKGDNYIISPKGIDYNKPEELYKFQDEINSIQELIENKINKDNDIANSDIKREEIIQVEQVKKASKK